MKISAVILAAGSGTRLGGVAKALLDSNGGTYLGRILAAARRAGLHEAIVVVGPPHNRAVASHARKLDARVVENPYPERGMGSSVALGFEALGDADAAWLWPVDHPDVDPATLKALIAKLGKHAAVRPVYEKRGGHPPLITRALFPALIAAAGVEGGARTILAESDTLDVPVDDPGVVRDIDTPDDLKTP